MESPKFLLSLATATLLMGGCVYVPPPDYYGGPPPPSAPPPPPPYYYDGGPPPDDMYFRGGGRRTRDFELDLSHRRRGRTEYLREADPDYRRDESMDEQGPSSGARPDEGYGTAENDAAPPPPASEAAPPPPAPEKKIDPASVPYATKSNNPGRAKSPYPPYRELDVAGMKSGSLAKDPTSGKVFRVP